MLTKEEKKQILNSLLETIKGISDKEYQKRVWIQGEGPEVDDFDESVCNFFGDGDPVLKNYQDFGITIEQYNTLKIFRDEFEKFCKGIASEYYLPALFINTLEWKKIIELAKEVLKALFPNRKIEEKEFEKVNAGFVFISSEDFSGNEFLRFSITTFFL